MLSQVIKLIIRNEPYNEMVKEYWSKYPNECALIMYGILDGNTYIVEKICVPRQTRYSQGRVVIKKRSRKK